MFNEISKTWQIIDGTGLMSLRPDMCIGVDLDNTLAIYGDLLHQLAVSRGLVTSIVKKDKTVIRDKTEEGK